MSVVARFYVSQVTRNAFNRDHLVVKLSPVSRGPENKAWSSATPSGNVEMTIANPSAADWFNVRLGKEVAITFEDRPLLCPKCHEEVPGPLSQYDGSGLNWRSLDDGRVEHVDCTKK